MTAALHKARARLLPMGAMCLQGLYQHTGITVRCNLHCLLCQELC